MLSLFVSTFAFLHASPKTYSHMSSYSTPGNRYDYWTYNNYSAEDRARQRGLPWDSYNNRQYYRDDLMYNQRGRYWGNRYNRRRYGRYWGDRYNRRGRYWNDRGYDDYYWNKRSDYYWNDRYNNYYWDNRYEYPWYNSWNNRYNYNGHYVRM